MQLPSIFGQLVKQVWSFERNSPHVYVVLPFYGLGISFCGLSVHFVDDENSLHMFYLGCKPYTLDNQKAKTVRMFIEQELSVFGLTLGNHSYVVSDNENKMKAAFSDVNRVGCADHYLSKRLQHAFTDSKADAAEVQTLFSTVKALVSNIRCSHRQVRFYWLFKGIFTFLNSRNYRIKFNRILTPVSMVLITC